MCWKTKHKELTEPKTATKPLKTFKVCKEYPHPFNPDKVTSFYFNKEYKKDESYTLNGDIQVFYDDFQWSEKYRIDYGFHSYDPDKIRTEKDGGTLVFYTTKDDYTLDVYALGSNILYRVECTVPKGSVYYENEYGEIVSDKIRIDSITEID